MFPFPCTSENLFLPVSPATGEAAERTTLLYADPLPSLAAAGAEHFAAVFGGHSFSKTVAVNLFPVARLVCPFHVVSLFWLF